MFPSPTTLYTALWIHWHWIGFFFFRGGWERREGPEWRQQRGRICPLRSVWMYTSGPGEAALGASRLLNTPILGAAEAGQVISIIRGEGSYTYGNAVVGGWGLVVWVGILGAVVGSWGVSGVGVFRGCAAAWGDPRLQLPARGLPVSVLSLSCFFPHFFISQFSTLDHDCFTLPSLCGSPLFL